MPLLLDTLVRELAPAAIDLAVAYLSRFGYVKTGEEITAATISAAQQVLGVAPDGVLGPQTLKAMQTLPRCGCADVQRLGGVVNQWQRELATGNGLTYAVERYTTGLSKSDQDDLLDLAFQQWESVCGIKIDRITSRTATSRAHFVISSSAKASEEFGQAGNVLAWCELPQGSRYDGKIVMKFDDAERWVREGDRGILYLNVACHEIGHGIGLDHTQVEGELMFPIYAPGVALPQQNYDVPQAVQRYGQSLKTPVPTPVPGDDSLASQVLATLLETRRAEVAALEKLARN